jgi:hypothetical protein
VDDEVTAICCGHSFAGEYLCGYQQPDERDMIPAMTVTMLVAALVVLAVVVAALSGRATARRSSQPRPTRERRGLKGRMDRAVLTPLGLLLVITVIACSRSGATSEKTARKLARSPQAVKARQDAEARMRKAIASWNTYTPLTLGLITVDDVCIPGQVRQWFFSSGDDQYKIRCHMYVTAYFGADPRRMADTIDGILSAGDRPGSVVPFGHDFQYARNVVDYYRGKPGDPQGPGTGEPNQLKSAGPVSLNWDQVITRGTRKLIEEPRPCAPADPPMRRCVREPEDTRVAELRHRYGAVFKLTFATSAYHVVRK